ncbi:MAG: peptidyl-prolyl cis-trans isomerase [Polyangiales bacterium]
MALAAGCGGNKAAPSAATSAKAPAQTDSKNGLTAEQSKQVLAKIGDTTITLGDFAERLSTQSPYLRSRYASPERRREFLDNMVRFELLALEAKKRGHDQEPEVQRVRRQMMVQQMMKEMFDEKGIKLSDITDAEIKAYYDGHLSEFHKPAQRRASQILWKDKVKDRAKAEAALKQLPKSVTPPQPCPGCKSEKPGAAQPDDMEAFRKLAREQSQDEASKANGGDLHFFSREPAAGDEGPPKAVREAVFALANIGDVATKVIESEQGLHVVKLTGERQALDRSLEDTRRLIQNRLWREKREAAIDKFVADLQAKADVKQNLDLLSQVKIDATSPAAAPDPDADEAAEERAASGTHAPAKAPAKAEAKAPAKAKP